MSVLEPSTHYECIEDVIDALVDGFAKFFEDNGELYFKVWFEYISKIDNRQGDRDNDRAFAALLANYFLDKGFVHSVSRELRADIYCSWRIAETLLHEAFDSPTFTSSQMLIEETKRTIRLRLESRRHDLYI